VLLLLAFVVFVAVAVSPVQKVDVQIKNPKMRTWQAGVNENFKNFTKSDVKKLLGWKPRKDKEPLPKIQHKISGLPVNFDSSIHWPQCKTIGTIYDQARCGSCWAFGAVEAISDRLCIQTNTTLLLSFQDMNSCGPDDGCNGGDAGDAWNYAQNSGIVTSTCYPYTIPTCPPAQEPCLNFVATPDCNQQCVDSEVWSSSKHFMSSAYSVGPSASQIQQEMFTNGPVEACFSVYEDFVTYKKGVYSHTTGDYLGGHCVKCIGWGVENGTPYWLCNNSWTTYWGNNGQFKILRGQDECGIEDDVVAGMPPSSK